MSLPLAAALDMEKVGAITINADNTTISRKIIVAGGTGIDNSGGYDDVTIEDCLILYNGNNGSSEACGVLHVNADRPTIRRCEIINIGSPTRGELGTTNKQAFNAKQCSDVTISNLTTRRGSDGVRLLECSGSSISNLESHDVRGSKPRGMAIQLASCTGTHLLQDLSDESIPGTSFNEDNFSIFNTSNVTIQRVFIPMTTDSPSGRGIVVESSNSGVTPNNILVEDFEISNVFNGAWCGGDYIAGLHFENMRSKGWNLFGSRGLAGSSNSGTSLCALVVIGTSAPTASNCLYYGLPSVAPDGDASFSTNLFSNPGGSSITLGTDIVQRDWTPSLNVIRNTLLWRQRLLAPSHDLKVRIGSNWLNGVFGSTIVNNSILGVLPGRYKHDPTTRSWQWLRDSSDISGQTGMNYLVNTSTDSGHYISVRETVSTPAGSYSEVSDPVYVP